MTLIRPVWRKSTHSTEGTSAQCVEVAPLDGVIGVRDSRRPGDGHITLTPEAFNAFVQEIKGARS
ncbi:DUF397 domain-containing protein [Actinomadura welshii]